MNHLADTLWDAIIVGAGPAGSFSACLLAQRGWKTLLVEKFEWPRDKPCGGCINAAAMRILQNAGLAHVLADAAPLAHMNIHLGRETLALDLPPGIAIERRELDRRFVAAAIDRGTTFQPHTTATLLPETIPSDHRTVELIHQNTRLTIRGKTILACDGLRGSLLAREPWAAFHTARPARLGFAATIPAPHDFPPPHTLAMCIADSGYVGLVRLSNNLLHLGAALDPAACNAHHGPLAIIQSILNSTGTSPSQLAPTTSFIGTGPLTRHRTTLAGHRVLAIGDACGYVEPFTGEGIAWALRGAHEATQLLHSPDAWHDSLPAAWNRRYDAHVRRRQVWCRQLRSLLQRPHLAAACMTVAQALPWLPQSLARRISA